MIGKGAQYLTAAGFGRYRITAASLGSLDLLDSIGWLRWATKQSIMDAFGVDGTAVIQATNEYLNGIAASDNAKATALAGFINEDPMMVCSLGLEPQGVTMPRRYLYNGGTAFLDLGFVPNQTLDIEFGYYDVGNQMGGVWGANQSWTGNVAMAAYASSTIHCYYDGDKTLSCPAGENIVKANKDKFQINNNSTTISGIIKNINSNLTFFKGGGRMCNAKMPYIKVYGDTERDMIPFKTGKAWAAEDVSTGVAQAAGTCGMIDLVSGKFFPNANSSGSFTIPDISYTPTP